MHILVAALSEDTVVERAVQCFIYGYDMMTLVNLESGQGSFQCSTFVGKQFGRKGKNKAV